VSVAEKAKHKEPNLVSHDMGMACAFRKPNVFLMRKELITKRVQ
jgi:hypothetical protein